MWIAKPILALGEGEIAIWARIQAKFNEYGRDFPLSQTLTYAHANGAIGSDAYLVMEPDLGVGGVLQLIGDSLECINGPLLHWDDPFNITQEYATFAMGAAKACPKARKIVLRPRWIFDHAEVMKRRLGFLPGEPAGHTEAWTLQIPILDTLPSQLTKTRPRFRRSLRRTERVGFKARISPATGGETGKLREFVEQINVHGKEHQFFVPPEDWFRALLSQRYPAEKFNFDWIDVTSKAPEYQGSSEGFSSHLLIAKTPSIAYYLFGYDRRGGGNHAAISPAVVAHAAVFEQCIKEKFRLYDLNGYLNPEDEAASGTAASYQGVAQFKRQFGGAAVRYYCPRFEISV